MDERRDFRYGARVAVAKRQGNGSPCWTGFRLARVGRDMSKNLISSRRTLISPVFQFSIGSAGTAVIRRALMVGCRVRRVNCGRERLASYLRYLTCSTCWDWETVLQLLRSVLRNIYPRYLFDLTLLVDSPRR